MFKNPTSELSTMSFFPRRSVFNVIDAEANNHILNIPQNIQAEIFKFCSEDFFALRFTCKYFYDFTSKLYWETDFWKEPGLINQQILVIYNIIQTEDLGFSPAVELYPLWLYIQKKIKSSERPNWGEIVESVVASVSLGVDFLSNSDGPPDEDEDFHLFLTDAFKNTSLTSIELLNDESVGLKGTIAIAEALKVNKTLMEIFFPFQDCSGRDFDGAIAIAEALKVNETLTEISIHCFDLCIGDAHKVLAEALKANQTLETINLTLDRFTDECATALAEAVVMREQPIELRGIKDFDGYLAEACANIQERNKHSRSSGGEVDECRNSVSKRQRFSS